MKGNEIFKPFEFCVAEANQRREEHMEKNAVPVWVNVVITEKSSGKQLGFEEKPTLKLGNWHGGGRWIVLK
ncbi:MAG: hypothetical protein KAS32_02405 [Candidatus Peribacteraceae bacterium]|nr:hypothetical protein [Candidatus Peribacteraceae bacterium]